MRICLKEGVTGNTGARSARGPDPIAENVNTLVTRLCTITGRARASRQANMRSRARTRANAYAPRASLYAPALKVAILNSLSNDTTERRKEEKQKEEEVMEERKRETLRLVAPACGNTRKPITQPAPGSLEADSLHAIPCKRDSPLRAA